ncbi:hypothetical protein ANACOL_00358 [Anaerotruncus colihominis DSM 17241]|uniref:Uncharacterized protein n=1 Tax=Anaerotruncus colihominis DSM 17241 TaxID=445972 RepID=B0P6I1_9FIRM|nr:hypothetical protein ANACOL_00358 [Anaerotruncus colihominis DSM 17241]
MKTGCAKDIGRSAAQMYPEPDTTFWNFDKINKIIYFNIDLNI